MAVSRETVLYYDPAGGERAAALKAILVQMGARIKNVPPEAVGQTVGCLLGRKGMTPAKTRKRLCWPSLCSCWTGSRTSGSRSCCAR